MKTHTENPGYFTAIDTEWDAATEDPVSVQVVTQSRSRYFFLDSDLKNEEGYPESLIAGYCRENEIKLRYVSLKSGTFDCVKYVLETEAAPTNIELLMFYSPRDIWQAHGFENVKGYLAPQLDADDNKTVKQIRQKRNINGAYRIGDYTINIRDLKGWASNGLVKLAQSVGVEMLEKTSMDDYKTKMKRGLIEQPESFIRYAMSDTTCLFDIYQKQLESIQWVQRDILGLPDEVIFNTLSLPMTTGSIVAKSIQKYLENNLGDPRLTQLVFRKLGELDDTSKSLEDVKKHQASKRNRGDVLSQVRTLEDLDKLIGSPKLETFLKQPYKNLAYSQCTPRKFGSETSTTEAYLAVVQGGRANNEIPSANVINHVLDADLGSAYATAMIGLIYPIGLPRVESFTANQKRINLKQALKLLEDAEPGCWTITLSGELSFPQDIIADEGELKSVAGELQDTRTHRWFALPLRDIFGKLRDTRAELKQTAKNLKAKLASDSSLQEEYNNLNAQQEALKLFINTGYGVMVSPYFDIGNTIVGNNITAMVRANAWMMAKALRCSQIITDGGLFETQRVLFIKTDSGKLPSLASLSDVLQLQRHRNVRLDSLGGVNWEPIFQEAVENPDATISLFRKHGAERLVNEHIRNFWAAWKLGMSFDIELKEGHEAVRAAYYGKADYALQTPSGERIYKVRGARKHSETSLLRNHPKFALLDSLIDGDDFKLTADDLEYDHTYLLKIGRYAQAQLSTGYENLHDLRPGDNVVEPRTFSMNNSYTHFDTDAEFTSVDRRGKRKTSEQLFERFLPQGLKHTLAKMLENSLRETSYTRLE